MEEFPHQQSTTEGTVGHASHHDSARLHVQGGAQYIDDMPTLPHCLHLAPGFAPVAKGKITSMNLDKVRAAPGVVRVLIESDIPGHNDTSPTHSNDDPMLSSSEVSFYGQVLFCVCAHSHLQARQAARLAEFEFDASEPIVSIAKARAQNSEVSPGHTQQRGDAASALAQSSRTLSGNLQIGGQDHFYLEGQIAMSVPDDEGNMTIYSSTQHPSEVQHITAQLLDLPDSAIRVIARRMGGAFGGKESQATQWAGLAALASYLTKRPAKCRLDRDDDMMMTGKRHDFNADYSIGFDDTGKLQAVDIDMYARCGISKDLSDAICDRAMYHADNVYFYPHAKISAARMKTNTVSNTAFRGFGGPQGMMVSEWIMERVARATGQDPLDVRKRNLYCQGKDDNLTPYFMPIEDFVAPELIETLERTAKYRERRKEIAKFNRTSPIIKRGMALTPVRFGISFTASFLNQAGALVHIYKDGSILLNHGGTEMGQGLYKKIAQVVATSFDVTIDKVRLSAADTSKIPNTSATAASSGADMNGMAAKIACDTLRQRLIDFAANHYQVAPDTIEFCNNNVQVGNQLLSFNELALQAYMHRIQLSATGFYRTPVQGYDREKAQGSPFYYFAYGAAVSEVAIDTMTGESRTLQVDILHDVGRSLNPAIDTGQIEGGFVQGMGWLTSEELVYGKDGRLQTHAPSTYKIPTCADVPEQFTVNIWDKGCNMQPTIYRSKAVGEPPFMLAISVFHAIADAISSVCDYKQAAQLNAPATPEEILRACDIIKQSS